MADMEHARDDSKHVNVTSEPLFNSSLVQTNRLPSVPECDAFAVPCLIPSFAAAAELLSAPYSCLVLNTHHRHIVLPPMYLHKKRTGIRGELETELLRFSQRLNGVPLAYDNIRIIGEKGDIYDDSSYIHMDIQADFVVFQPTKGQKLLGKVNKLGISHVGCLVHGCFNASIPKPNLVSVETWRVAGPRIGSELEFEVMALDADNVGVLLVRGRLDKTRVQELIAMEENSQMCVSTEQPEAADTDSKPEPENETNKSLTDIKTDEQSAVEIYTKTETGFACQHPVSRLYQNPYDCVYQCPSDYVYKCTVGYSYQGPTDYSHQSSAGYTYQGPADYAHQSTVLYAYEGPTSYPQQNTAGYAYLGPATFGPQTVGYTYQGPADYTQHSKVGYNYGGPASYIYQDPATYAHPNMVGYSYQDPANYAQQSTVVYAYQGAANYGHQSTTGSTYRHVPFNSYRGHSSNAYRGPTYTNYRRPSYTNYRHQNHNNYRHPAFNNYRHKGYNNYRCPPYTINYRHPIYSNYGCPTFNKFRGAAYSQYKDTAYNQYPKKYVWKNNAHDVSGNTKTNVSQAAAKTGNQSAITESSNEKTNMITMLREKIAMLDLKAESDRKKEAENWLGNVEKSVDHEPATPMVQQGQETSHCAVVQMHEDLDKQRHEWHQGKSFLVESLRNAKQGLDNRDREITTSRDELMEKLITLDNQAEETEDAQRKPKKRAVKKLFLQLLRKTGGT